MKPGRYMIICALLLVASLTAFGQQPQPLAGKTPHEAGRARLDELRAAGFEALYNLDYEGARRQFKEIVRLFPEHPAGPQFLAATLWTQTLNEARRLQSSLYSSESFYNSKSEDAVDPRTVEQFRELTRQAAQLAKARLDRKSTRLNSSQRT